MTEPKWQITVAVPLSLDRGKRDGLFSRIADAVHDWEEDHGGADWDTDVYGQPAPSADPATIERVARWMRAADVAKYANHPVVSLAPYDDMGEHSRDYYRENALNAIRALQGEA